MISSKSTQMVICQFQCFGESTGELQLEKSYPQGGGSHRTTLQVQSVAKYKNSAYDVCLKIRGNILGTIINVQSDCLEPFTPTLEEWQNGNGELVTTAVMRVSDIHTSFDDMLSHHKHHNPKEKHQITIMPILVGRKEQIMVANVSEVYEDIVCNIYRPPKIIAGPTVSGSTYNKTKVNRLIRNHMTSHQLMNEYGDDCCAFCRKAGCKLSVALERCDTMQIRDFKPLTDPWYKAPMMMNYIRTATVVHPNCITYPSIKPFMYKVCNKGTG